MDLPRSFTIRETHSRIIDPFTPEKLAVLGAAIRLRSGATVLDLCCGKGEMLATWARDHGIGGTGVDISTVNIATARERATSFGVADRLEFIHANAAGFLAPTPVDVAACIGATWIGNGPAGTIELLDRSLRPGGMILIGEPFWRSIPPDQEAVEACHAGSVDDFMTLTGLVAHFGDIGWDLVEMVLADEDSWDRYVAAQWLAIRTWLDANPDDELADEFRLELRTAPARYVRYQRQLLGWGVFALMKQ